MWQALWGCQLMVYLRPCQLLVYLRWHNSRIKNGPSNTTKYIQSHFPSSGGTNSVRPFCVQHWLRKCHLPRKCATLRRIWSTQEICNASNVFLLNYVNWCKLPVKHCDRRPPNPEGAPLEPLVPGAPINPRDYSGRRSQSFSTWKVERRILPVAVRNWLSRCKKVAETSGLEADSINGTYSYSGDDIHINIVSSFFSSCRCRSSRFRTFCWQKHRRKLRFELSSCFNVCVIQG